ncbi:hypothetical protein SAMN06265365_111104 [Tistlia consotensis]|uniref:Uncharacterized protein n=1 Tax=Tistlia consotensis USBA 355 TaxID=560819 RepID=A0A1Y6BXM0_9PROT|nr:hypothetical protein [Tistlia consotensis]SMF33147.1 hypothetical protein SAMN05428998_111106 [Tistlia consotensis USBA 355]SNR69465.1 hypothetical protein SAMN06265365_111104 [Tistlia consotensis]
MRLRPLLQGLLLLLPMACAPAASVPWWPYDTPAPILQDPPSFGEVQFRRSCVDSRGYAHSQCDCALRSIRQRFDGKDRKIALLYLQLTMVAEHDVQAIMAWLDPEDTGTCPPQPVGSVAGQIGRLHRAPAYLYGVLKLIEVSPDQFEDWAHRDEIQEVRNHCLPPPPSITHQAQRIESCIADALKIRHCSRCHDYRGVDLTQ